MIKKIITLLFTSEKAALGLIALISISALTTAFLSEGFLGLEPCVLCIYQRYPFAFAALIGIIGSAICKSAFRIRVMLGLSSIIFAINSAIAFYHSGVERHWWVSAFEGCKMNFASDTPQSFLENIMSAPAASCDSIPWQDPILGLSMANINVILCAGLCLYALSVFILSHKKKSV